MISVGTGVLMNIVPFLLAIKEKRLCLIHVIYLNFVFKSENLNIFFSISIMKANEVFLMETKNSKTWKELNGILMLNINWKNNTFLDFEGDLLWIRQASSII